MNLFQRLGFKSQASVNREPSNSIKPHKLRLNSIISIEYSKKENEELIEKKQIRGRIISINEERGYQIKIEGSKDGRTCWIPFDYQFSVDSIPWDEF